MWTRSERRFGREHLPIALGAKAAPNGISSYAADDATAALQSERHRGRRTSVRVILATRANLMTLGQAPTAAASSQTERHTRAFPARR
jgi:hypothetical protein